MSDPRMNSLLTTLSEVLDVLSDLKVPCVVGGSVACIAHGRWRTTEDVDIAAKLEPQHVPEFCARLEEAFSLYEPAIAESVARQSSFALLHKTRIEKVDVFVAGSSPFENMQFDRKVVATLPDESGWKHPLPLTAAEEIVLHKLMWFEKGNRVSERQWRDILGVLANQYGKLDLDYMKAWAFKLHVAELLDEALDQAHKNVHGIDDGTNVI